MRRTAQVVPEDVLEEEAGDSRLRILREKKAIVLSSSDEEDEEEDASFDADAFAAEEARLLEDLHILPLWFRNMFGVCGCGKRSRRKKKKKTSGPDPVVRKYHQLKEKNTELLQVLRIVEPWSWDFYDVFVDMDEDGGGEIEFDEFLHYYSLEDTKFSERIFAEFDKDQSGGMNFAEFVAATWNYCSSTREDLLKYAFDMYDIDGNGTLEPVECASLLRMIFAQDELDDTLKKIIVEMDADGDGEIDFGELLDYVEDRPFMIEPMITMRTILRNSICGARYWREMTEWRQRQFGPHADMSQIIAYKSIIEAKLKDYVKRNDAIARGRDQHLERIKATREKREMETICRKASGVGWLQWIYGQAVMTLLHREADKMQHEDNTAAAKLRQEIVAKERTITYIMKDLGNAWDQQKIRLNDKYGGEASRELEEYLQTETWKAEMKSMIDELLKMREAMASTGLDSVEKLTREAAQEKIETKMARDAKEKASQRANEAYETQIRAFEADNKQMFLTIRDGSDEMLTRLKDGEWDAWVELVGRDVMDAAPQDKTMSFLEYGKEILNEEEIERERMQHELARMGGFKGRAAVDYGAKRDNDDAPPVVDKSVVIVAKHPFCPQCEHEGSSATSNFCRYCGSPLWVETWDDVLNVVTYECVSTGETSLAKPVAIAAAATKHAAEAGSSSHDDAGTYASEANVSYDLEAFAYEEGFDAYKEDAADGTER
eukprot:g710.t1